MSASSLLLIAMLSVGRSSLPPHDAAKRAEQTDSAQNQKRGSDSLPVAVKLLNTGKSEKEAAQDSARVADGKQSERRNFWLTVILSAATVVQAFALIITIGDAKKTTITQLRGYVFFDSRGPWSRTGTLVALRFRNFGQTPVKDVEVFGYVTAARSDHAGALPDGERATDVFKTSLGPQVALDAHFTSHLSGDDQAKVTSGKFFEHVHGRVEYTDAFKQRRATRFCYHLAGTELRNCTEGNDWT